MRMSLCSCVVTHAGCVLRCVFAQVLRGGCVAVGNAFAAGRDQKQDVSTNTSPCWPFMWQQRLTHLDRDNATRRTSSVTQASALPCRRWITGAPRVSKGERGLTPLPTGAGAQRAGARGTRGAPSVPRTDLRRDATRDASRVSTRVPKQGDKHEAKNSTRQES